ncbi:MAG TPA: hypothetical protein VJI33_01815, partial [Candidatus Paceibacterota bacterium]
IVLIEAFCQSNSWIFSRSSIVKCLYFIHFYFTEVLHLLVELTIFKGKRLELADYLLPFSQIFLKNKIEKVDRINPTVGTMAFTNGFGNPAKKKKITMATYVSTAIIIFRAKLVSQALSSSTLAFRFLIYSISFFNCCISSIYKTVYRSDFLRQGTKKSVTEVTLFYLWKLMVRSHFRHELA